MADILTSIHGREYGLDKEGQPIWNLADGSQMRLTKAELAAMQALVPEAWMSGAILALIGFAPTRVYLDSQPLWLDNSPILS